MGTIVGADRECIECTMGRFVWVDREWLESE